jgi:hypothetical protein
MIKKALLFALLVAAAGCASASAKTPSDRPTLEVPPPPPRVIEPAAPIEAPPEPVADLPAATPTSPARPRPQSREGGTRESVKTEPKPETTAEPPPQPQPVPPVQTPPESQLRTPGTADGAEAARQVKEILDRTVKSLSSIDYRVLSGERRKAYDEAKEFMRNADDALKKASYVLARSLAEKAEKLTRELQGR